MLASWMAARAARAKIITAEAHSCVLAIESESIASATQLIADAQTEARNRIGTSIESRTQHLEISGQAIVEKTEFQERKRVANIESVLRAAANELGDKHVADHEPDADWTSSFFDYVQDVSSEELQSIWAKLLAGEVESPGRASLRTLATLRNMSKDDAELFCEACRLVIGPDGIFNPSEDDSTLIPLSYKTLLRLQDCGLVSVLPTLVRSLRWNNPDVNEIPLINPHRALVVVRTSPSVTSVNWPAVPLTQAGVDLHRVTNRGASVECLRAFAKHLQANNCEVYELMGATDVGEKITYQDRELIAPH